MIRKGALFCAFAAAAFLVSQWHRLIPESSPAARGAAAVNAEGCIECHGQSDPGFPDDIDLSCANVRVNSAHPRYEGLCSDVLAYFEIVRLKRSFDERVNFADQNPMLQGEILARQYNCFQCHGELGQGGFRNAGAFKGYIPGYFGNDFALLTRGGSAESVRNWIGRGIDPALFANPIEGRIAEYFIERQEVSMPIFESLPDSTIQVLADYVVTLNRFGPMDAKAIRAYGLHTQQTAD